MEKLFKKVLREISAAQSIMVESSLDDEGAGGKIINPLEIKRKIGKGIAAAVVDPQTKSMEQKQQEMKEKALGKLGIQNLDEIVDYFSDSEWNEFLTLYQLLDVVGSGGFGVVLSAYDNKNKCKVALKIVVKENVKGVMLQKEFEILKQMNHPNVVSIYNILNYSNFLIISMSIGIETVWDMVKRRQLEENPLTDEECSQIARGLLTGLAYIHDDNNIIHRDIKEQNLLITQYQDLSLS